MSRVAGHIWRVECVDWSHGHTVQTFWTNCPDSLDSQNVQTYCTEVPPKAPTAPRSLHPAHAANMAAKADRVARWIHANLTADADVVARLDDTDWERIADAMGETRVPSPATRAMAVVLVRALNAAEMVARRTAKSDPFAGLPS
jgi:hypothetical protein